MRVQDSWVLGFSEGCGERAEIVAVRTTTGSRGMLQQICVGTTTAYRFCSSDRVSSLQDDRLVGALQGTVDDINPSLPMVLKVLQDSVCRKLCKACSGIPTGSVDPKLPTPYLNLKEPIVLRTYIRNSYSRFPSSTLFTLFWGFPY